MSQDSERRPRRAVAHTLEEARAIAKRLWFPIAIKPSFTLAGAGSSVAASQGEFERKFLDALALSPTGEVLLEKPEGASPILSDSEFEKWLADMPRPLVHTEKEWEIAVDFARLAWHTSSRNQIDHDVAVASQHRVMTSSLVGWFGACSCGVIPEGTLVDFETEEEWLEHLRQEFGKETPSST